MICAAFLVVADMVAIAKLIEGDEIGAIMKKNFSILLLLVIALSFAACAPKEDISSLPTYQVTENEELNCIELSYNGITYRPYGACDKALLDKKIGVLEGESNVFVYSIKDYDSSQWICDMIESGLMDAPMLLKAVGVTDIPDALKKYTAYDF